jgi:hypothetical protein
MLPHFHYAMLLKRKHQNAISPSDYLQALQESRREPRPSPEQPGTLRQREASLENYKTDATRKVDRMRAWLTARYLGGETHCLGNQ